MRVLAPGTVLGGYRIESMVGRGGMGVVYRAVELELERVVALKVITPGLLGDGDVSARFLREARAAAAIEHANVIPVHAAGVVDGVAFLTMRFVDGDDLRKRVRRVRALAVADAVAVLEQAAAGLDAIHRAGFVHRDVKPANLLLDAAGHLYVSDFGLVKRALSESGATSTGQWVGSLDYVAPEQVRGGRIDARADVYALGGVLYFALTGHVPFERESDEAKLWAQLSEAVPAPSLLRPDVSPELDAVVARAMSKSPDSRFPSAGDLARAARAAAGRRRPTRPEQMVARGAAAPGGAPSEPGIVPEASTASAPRATEVLRATRRRRRAPLVAALALVVAGAATVALLARDAPPPADPQSGAAVAEAPEAPPSVRVAQTIEGAGTRPNALVYAAGELWVASHAETTLTRIDAASGRVLAQRPRVGRGVISMAADRDTVWVVVGGASLVLGFDVRTGKRVRRLHFPDGPPRRVAAGASGLWILLAPRPEQGQRLLHYDRAGRRMRGELRLRRSHHTFTLGGRSVWLADAGRRGVLELDARSYRRRSFKRIGGEATTLTYAAGHVWAPVGEDDRVVRLDPRSSAGRAEFAAGQRPTQAVLAGGLLFVACRMDHTVRVFDPVSTRPEPLTVPINPSAMATDGRSVWVTGLVDGSVTRISGD